MTEWYNRVPAQWKRDQELCQRYLEDVVVEIANDGRATITGTYPLRLACDHVDDRFRLRFVYPANFLAPGVALDVYLLSHRDRWQNVRDSHIECNWRLCLYVPWEVKINFQDGDALLKVLPAVHTFLRRQIMYQEALRAEPTTGVPAVWPGPQRSHEAAGIREAIRERGKISRNAPCPCGSGKKFKRCHWHQVYH